MKVCKKCNSLNEDSDVVCKNCLSSGDIFKEYTSELSKISKKFNTKNKIKFYIKIVSVILYIITFLFLTNINKLEIINTIILTLPSLLGFILIKFTESVFIILHISSVNDIDKSQMSYMYNIYLKIVGSILMLYPLIKLTINIIINN